jgi:hypothetical protein
MESATDSAFKDKLNDTLELALVVCSTISLSFSHIILDEHAASELVLVDTLVCEQLWMLCVLLWHAPGTVHARLQQRACAAVLACSLTASHPSAVLSLEDPARRGGMDFVPVEMQQLQHSPTWYPSSDGSCKRQLSHVIACAASAFNFDNEFAHEHPEKLIVGCILLLLEGEDVDMMQRALNALQVLSCYCNFSTALEHSTFQMRVFLMSCRACVSSRQRW